MTITPDHFAAIEQVGGATFSRDGRTLFYLAGSGLAQPWARDLDTGRDRRLATHDEKVAMLRRSPVDDRIVYGIDRGGDERQQLMLLSPDGGEPVALTDDPGVIHDWGGWSPDGSLIAFAANDRAEAHFDVLVQDLATGARTRVYEGEGIVSVAGFRGDGACLAVLHDRGQADMSLILIDLGTGEATRFPDPGGTNYASVRWAADKRTLLALTDHGGAEFMRLCRLDPDSGAVTEVYAAPGREVDGWAASSDGAMLATIENDRGWSVLRVGPFDGDRPVVAGLPDGVISEPAFAPDGQSLAFTLAAPRHPAAIWLWRDGAADMLISREPSIAADHLAAFELVEWESFDGARIPGLLALPAGPVPAGGHRAIIWVHGGPVGQVRPNFRADLQMLVGQGFAVLAPNVRGSSGYGRSYLAADDLEKRPDCVADLAHGRHWLAAHPAINGDRIAIMGQSYGGYMVSAALTEYPDLWTAAVNYYGIADFITTLDGTGPWRREHRAAEYGHPDRHAELLVRLSPINKVERIRVPVLLAHGTRDPRVPYGESVRLEAALRERQRPVTFLTFDYAGHGFIRPEDKRRVYNAVASFFTAHA